MPKLLTIQSHVVHGYVGNKAATFPLQYKGWDVDCVNTVQFSNHPGYGFFKGSKYDADNLFDIISQGLFDFLEIDYECILIGYFPSAIGLGKLMELLMTKQSLKSTTDSQNGLFISKIVVDPVLGDNGKLYVAQEMVDLYKQFLKNVEIYCCTPNQFEIETLTGIKVNSLSNLYKAMMKFHSLYPKVEKLVVTSCINLFENDSNKIINASFDSCQDTNKIHVIESSLLDCYFSGCGDLYTALLTNELLQSGKNLQDSMNYVVSTISQILDLTKKLYLKDVEILNITPTMRNNKMVINDLKLIESRIFLNNDFQPEKLFNLVTIAE